MNTEQMGVLEVPSCGSIVGQNLVYVPKGKGDLLVAFRGHTETNGSLETVGDVNRSQRLDES